jgi:hypothetical protein
MAKAEIHFGLKPILIMIFFSLRPKGRSNSKGGAIQKVKAFIDFDKKARRLL